MMNIERFISYLTEPRYEFDDEVKSLVVVFLYEHDYYNNLLEKGFVDTSAYYFLKIYERRLHSVEEQMLTREERKHLYESLVMDYSDRYEKGNFDKSHILVSGVNLENTKKKYEDIYKDVYINLCCPVDKNKIPIQELREYIIYEIKGKPHKQRKVIKEKKPFPVYYCNKCKRYYTSVEYEADKFKFKINNTIYINLTAKMHSFDYSNAPTSKVRKIKKAFFYIYDNSFKKCPGHNCAGKFSIVNAVFKTNDGKKCIKNLRQCNNCNAYFLSLTDFEKVIVPYEIINEADIPVLHENRQIRLQAEKEQSFIQQEKSRLLKEEKRKEKEEKRLAEELRRQEMLKQRELERQKKEIEYKKKQLAIEERKKYEKMSIDELPQIELKDFVVRRSIFKCMHNEHDVQDLIAALTIIDRSGNERKIRVNAGFCPNCNVFFILESTYELVRRQGIALCRISDEKSYLKSNTVNGMRLASESILMQYGYNVNKEANLTDKMRHRILANLIDRNILKKSEIISYLDFFVSQRQSQSKYQTAIGKWKADRNFVQNYKLGKYQEYSVHELYR